MRLTREALIKIARETAAQRVKISRRLVCIYLTGSVLEDDFMLGGTTDIDLICVHDSDPAKEREVIRLSDDVHLDIAHYAQEIFHQPRHLRTDPWIGPFIYAKPLVLHDTQHWFEFTQAATGAQFYQPDYSYQRAQTLAQTARAGWTTLQISPPETHAGQMKIYLQAMEDAGNALISLAGPPLTERRFFIHLGQRAQALNHPEISAHMMSQFLDSENAVDNQWPTWVSGWKAACLAASQQKDAPFRLHPGRLPYYERAAEALWEAHPAAALWIMLKIWTLAADTLPDDAPEQTAWHAAFQALKFAPEHMEHRVGGLDQTLDMIEEALEQWGRQNGVSNLE